MTHSVKLLYPELLLPEHEITRFARVSFDGDAYESGDTEKWQRLLWYLLRHNHTTPFRHVHVSFELSAALDVKAQLDKHQVGFASNAMSMRYAEASRFDFIEARGKAINNKQGSADMRDQERKSKLEVVMQYHVRTTSALYLDLLAKDVAPECARRVLPQCTITRWVATGSLWGWLNMIEQRTAPEVQKETRTVVQDIAQQLEPHYPFIFACMRHIWSAKAAAQTELNNIKWNEVMP